MEENSSFVWVLAGVFVVGFGLVMALMLSTHTYVTILEGLGHISLAQEEDQEQFLNQLHEELNQLEGSQIVYLESNPSTEIGTYDISITFGIRGKVTAENMAYYDDILGKYFDNAELNIICRRW